MNRWAVLGWVMVLPGCQAIPEPETTGVPVAVQTAIANDLFDVLFLEVNPDSINISIKPSSPGEHELSKLLTEHGYQVDEYSQFSKVSRTRLHVFFDEGTAVYMGTLGVGTSHKFSRQYRYDAQSLKTIGVTMVGER